MAANDLPGDRRNGRSVDQDGPNLELGHLTWVEASTRLTASAVILLPVGAIEAHGPHLPLDTDVIIAAGTAQRAARLLVNRGGDAVIAPPVAYGVSYVGTSLPGTTPAPAEALTALVASVLIELARWGPRRLVIVNAHLEPAHIAAIEAAVSLAEAASGARIAFPDQRAARWAARLSDEFRRGARHGGAYETSLLLAGAPHRVRSALLPNLPPVWVDLPARLRAGAETFAEAGMPEGYVGDPARASATEGERLFDALAQMVVTAVDELGNARPEPTPPSAEPLSTRPP